MVPKTGMIIGAYKYNSYISPLMRFLSYIMLILVSVQVMMPCMDGICEQNEDVELSISFDADDHEGETGHADHCTPFCTCSCCHSNYLSTGGQMFSMFEFPQANFVEPVSQPHSFYLDRIWQPPKA